MGTGTPNLRQAFFWVFFRYRWSGGYSLSSFLPHNYPLLAFYTCFLPNMSLMPTYPRDRATCMSEEGPRDPQFRVPGGTLLYKPERDTRFPYIYEIPTHTLVHSPKYIKRILIHVVDTSIDARKACANYESKLSVPLGPNNYMENCGEF